MGRPQVASVLTCTLDFDQRGFSDTGTRDPLSTGRAPVLLERPDLDGFADPRRLVERLNDPDILQTLLTRRLWRAILENAVRKVHELRRELITLPSGFVFFLPLISTVYSRPSAYS